MSSSPNYAFKPSIYSLPMVDRDGSPRSEYFPVNRIFCIGRNYADHAREMGHDPNREPPFYFLKPASALLANMSTFPLPSYSNQVEHEIEIVIALDRGGRNLSIEQARQAVVAFGLGLDMTCRDIQKSAKDAGRPWELAKGFDHSAPCTALQLGSVEDILGCGDFSLTNNNRTVQKGNARDMIWQIPELIMEISQKICLLPGDIIFTGTPAGVSALKRGDKLTASFKGLSQTLSINIE